MAIIEPYMAVGLVTTVWGARTRADIGRNGRPRRAHSPSLTGHVDVACVDTDTGTAHPGGHGGGRR